MQYDDGYSFEAADADVILVTAGGYSSEIRVHRCVLTAASPFFRDMFSLPQPPSTPSYSLPTSDSHIPRIPISETQEVFTNLLRYVYPISRPEINSLEDITRLLGPALKYDFVIAVNALREMLVSPKFLQEHPLRVYGIASSFDVSFPCPSSFPRVMLMTLISWKKRQRLHRDTHYASISSILLSAMK
jgi:hypothetical protein